MATEVSYNYFTRWIRQSVRWLMTTFLQDRYKGFCCACQRYYFDLKRRSLSINRDLVGACGQAAIQTLLPNNPKYILPIPQWETFANPNMH